MNNTGYIYVPEDERDYPICMAYDDSLDIEIPKEFKTSFQPPYEKQLCGNCVAQTLANIMEVMYYNMCNRHENFSVGFIYGNRDANEHKGEGMTGYLACSHLCKDGDVKSEVFDNPGSAPSIIEAVNEFKENNPDWAKNTYVPTLYIRTKSADEVKRFIYKYNIPVMCIIDIKHFHSGSGLHAMALYGWDNDKAIMQNSWGEQHSKRIVEVEFEKCKEFWLVMSFEIASFSDLKKTHWAYRDIMKSVEDKIFLGYPDGTIKPDNNVTRAEFCAVLYRKLQNKNKKKK